MVNVLARKAVLAKLSISRWGGRRFDDGVAETILDEAKANRDVGLFTKRLVSKKAMLDINRIAQQARTYHNERTLPWLDDGVRILPNALYMDYVTQVAAFKNGFFEAVESFAKDFPSFIEDAKKELGSLFKEVDYPSAHSVHGRFAFAITILPCPDAVDFRAELDKDLVADLRKDLDNMMTSQLTSALKDAGVRITQTVGHIAERLKGYKPADKAKGRKAEGKFHDSMIEHVKELADLLPAFNLSDDPKLEVIRQRILEELAIYEPNDLREDAKLRKRVAQSADQILKQVSEFLA